MSDGPIVSIAEVQRRAQVAFAAGKPITACPFNWSTSGAYVTWCEEYRRLARAKAFPEFHIEPVAVSGLDVQQTAGV